MISLRNIYPLSEFQRRAKAFLEKLRETKEPIILTVNGKASVVVQDAESYQELLDRLEILETSAGIRKSLEEFEQGKGIPLDEAFEQLRTKYDIQDMTYKVEVSPTAVADIEQIFLWMLSSSVDAAHRWVRGCYEIMLTLEKFPNRSPMSPESEYMGIIKLRQKYIQI
ncbi:MAG: type II toxin-antitoxin system prevent-host-death family antitoxin [Rivularia sp. (in: cyanobacteria)]